ncbi:MAG: hypothetical protein J2P41_06010 [Blastocatellia bacterium]|nr:hypothetical protein [Blastocatellia bacterium]
MNKKWENILDNVFNAVFYTLHIWTLLVAATTATDAWPAMVLTLFTPVLSWIYWFFVLWKKFGFWHSYNIAVIVGLIAEAIILRLDVRLESSQAPQSNGEESQDDL